jgi:RecA/RadA recombinase
MDKQRKQADQQHAVDRANASVSRRQQDSQRRESHRLSTDVKLDKALTIGVISGLTVEQFNALK